MKKIILAICLLGTLCACQKETDDIDTFGYCKSSYVDAYNHMHDSEVAYKNAYQAWSDSLAKTEQDGALESAKLLGTFKAQIIVTRTDCVSFYAIHSSVSCKANRDAKSDDFKPFCDTVEKTYSIFN